MACFRKDSNPTRSYVANMNEGVFKAQLYPIAHDPIFSAVASACHTPEDIQHVREQLQKVLPPHLVQTDDGVINAVVSICKRINDGVHYRPGVKF